MGIDLYNLVISAKLQKGGGGGDIEIDALGVTENGVYSASSGHAFDPVTVSVPQGVFPSGTSSITANGIYDITNFASVDVNVSGGGGGDHDVEDGLITRTISGVYENSRVTKIGSSAFIACFSLTTVSFPNATNISNYAFMSCSALVSAYFLASSVATLANISVFHNTPMSKSSYIGSFGSIYVPASLVDTYKNAYGWSAYASRITSYVE